MIQFFKLKTNVFIYTHSRYTSKRGSCCIFRLITNYYTVYTINRCCCGICICKWFFLENGFNYLFLIFFLLCVKNIFDIYANVPNIYTSRLQEFKFKAIKFIFVKLIQIFELYITFTPAAHLDYYMLYIMFYVFDLDVSSYIILCKVYTV